MLGFFSKRSRQLNRYQNFFADFKKDVLKYSSLCEVNLEHDYQNELREVSEENFKDFKLFLTKKLVHFYVTRGFGDLTSESSVNEFCGVLEREGSYGLIAYSLALLSYRMKDDSYDFSQNIGMAVTISKDVLVSPIGKNAVIHPSFIYGIGATESRMQQLANMSVYFHQPYHRLKVQDL